MSDPIQTHDLTGIRCPLPIVKLNQIIADAAPGDVLLVAADDPAFAPDVRAWCRRTGHELIELDQQDGVTSARLRRSA